MVYIYRDHNGEDVEVIYCLDEEALAEFDEFDEQIWTQLKLADRKFDDMSDQSHVIC